MLWWANYIHYVLFHNVTHYTNSLLSRLHAPQYHVHFACPAGVILGRFSEYHKQVQYRCVRLENTGLVLLEKELGFVPSTNKVAALVGKGAGGRLAKGSQEDIRRHHSLYALHAGDAKVLLRLQLHDEIYTYHTYQDVNITLETAH